MPAQSHYFTNDPNLPDDRREFTYYYGEQLLRLQSNSGVFSPGHVDPATDLLLRQIPPLKGSLLDLGCGYGVVGISLAKAYGVKVTMADINPRALQCAEINCRENGVEAELICSDCFENLHEQYDTIALNPPIHAGKDVMFRMFGEAERHLFCGGKFYIVMLEKHGAKSAAAHLGKIFGNCATLYKKKGYCVFCCEKNA